MRKKICFLLTVVACWILCIVPVSAIQAYGETDETKSSFISRYGWDRNKMSSAEWEGIDGLTHSRQSGFEKSFYEDTVKTNNALAVKLGLITDAPESGGNALSIIAVALAEVEAGVTDTPIWSNNVKYNSWYYGRNVMGDEYPWCCAFISWCADQCGLIDAGVFRKTAGCASMRAFFNEKGYDSYSIQDAAPYGGSRIPVPGDIIIWGANQHIALIVAVNADSIETVEGNTSPRVARQTYTKRQLQGNLATATIFHVQYPDNEFTIYRFLLNQVGLPEAAAIGVLANISCESGFNEHVLGDSGTSYGLCGWHLSRWDRLKAFCESNGYDWEELDGQLYYLQYELETYFPDMLARLRSVPNTEDGAYDAAFMWCHDFEIPVGYEFTTSNYRGNIARTTFWPKHMLCAV